MLQVWPSISSRRSAFSCSVRIASSRARVASGPQRVAVEVEVDVLEHDLLPGRTNDLDRDRVAGRAALAVGHRDRDLHRTFLHRRGPRRLAIAQRGELPAGALYL